MKHCTVPAESGTTLLESIELHKLGNVRRSDSCRQMSRILALTGRRNERRMDIMKLEFTSKEEIRAIGYEIDAEYVKGSDKNGAYWGEIDFSAYPPYPADLNDLGEIATWKHPADEKVKLAYYFGCVSDTQPVPEGFTEFTITAGDYAVVTASDAVGTEPKADTVAKMRAASKEFFAWLADSEYKYDLTKGMIFEYYKDDKAYLYVPVAKK